MSGLVAGLYVTTVISVVTDQHGASDSSELKVPMRKWILTADRGEEIKKLGVHAPLPCRILNMQFQFK